MSRARKVVAIVDTEESVRRQLKRLFNAKGIASEGFASGDRFLRFLKARRPDCVILGRHMPEAEGFEMLLRMALADLRIPVIVLAGRGAARSRGPRDLARILPFLEAPASKRRPGIVTSPPSARRSSKTHRKTS